MRRHIICRHFDPGTFTLVALRRQRSQVRLLPGAPLKKKQEYASKRTSNDGDYGGWSGYPDDIGSTQGARERLWTPHSCWRTDIYRQVCAVQIQPRVGTGTDWQDPELACRRERSVVLLYQTPRPSRSTIAHRHKQLAVQLCQFAIIGVGPYVHAAILAWQDHLRPALQVITLGLETHRFT